MTGFHPPLPASKLSLYGKLLTTWVTSTITSKETVSVLPDASVTRNVLVVVPSGKIEPLGNPAVCVIVNSSSGQLSVAVGVAKFTTLVLELILLTASNTGA